MKYNLVQINAQKKEIEIEKKKEYLWFSKENSKVKYRFHTEKGIFQKYKGGEFEIPTRSSLNSWFRGCSITTDNEIVARIILAAGGKMGVQKAAFPTIVEAIASDYYSVYYREWESIGIQFQEVTEILENGGLDLSQLPSLPYMTERPKYTEKVVQRYIREQSPVPAKKMQYLCSIKESELKVLKTLAQKREEMPELFEIEEYQYSRSRYENISVLDKPYDEKKLISLIIDFNLNIDRFIQYLDQLKRWEHTDIDWVLNNYGDYLKAERQLRNGRKMDKYPSNLVQAHHNKTQIVAKIEREKRRLAEAAQREADKIIYASNKEEFEYIDSNEEYCMIAPTDAEEVFDEGIKQSHCVGQYTEEISKKKTVIMFMRKVKQPDKPLLTVEIKLKYGLNMAQALGKTNRRANKEERAFLERYCDNHQNSDGEAAPILYTAYSRL